MVQEIKIINCIHISLYRSVNIVPQIVLEELISRFVISGITLEFLLILETKLGDSTTIETKFMIYSLILHRSSIMFPNQGTNTITI
jgi:hypothetical protein